MSSIRERPIIMSGESVRGILAGSKCQTRRVVNRLYGIGRVTEFQRSDTPAYDWIMRDKRMLWNDFRDAELMARCPYGITGDLLWLRETWGVGTRPDPDTGWRDGIEYRADEYYLTREADDLPLYGVEPPAGVDLGDMANRWRSPIHMPRWASRLNLRIASVRVERLHDISEEDAIAEGMTKRGVWWDAGPEWEGDGLGLTAREAFACTWGNINRKRVQWDFNPFVWVISFTVSEGGAR